VSSDTTRQRQGWIPSALLAALVVLAFALRFYRLGDWGFDSDETFTLRDSINPSLANPRPLLYFLNHYLVQPLVPLNELGLRLLPAIFGVLAIPVFYFVCRRLVGSRAALFGTLLLAVSALHVYYSQFARYWSLVFLLCTVYPFAIYLGLRDGNRRMLALGFLTAALAALAHPVSVLLLGGLGLWTVATYQLGGQPAQLWNRKSVRWGMLVAVILAAVIVLRFVPMLESWIKKPGEGEFLFHVPSERGVKQLSYLLSFVESLTLPLVLIAALGIYLLGQRQNHRLAYLLACMFLFPIAFLVLLSFRAPVSTFYLVPTLPILFVGAGVFLDRLADLEWELRPRWLLPTTLVIVIMAAGAPTLVSQYRDGRRYDYRGVARWLDDRLAPTDVVFSDQFKVLTHYMPGKDVRKLVADSAPLTQSVSMLRQLDRGGALWIVVPAPGHAFRTSPKIGSLKLWMYEHCQLRNTVGVGRVDFRQYHLQVYRCPAATPREAVADSR
jgi:mannosyltransferase